jgi:hypothetical protein
VGRPANLQTHTVREDALTLAKRQQTAVAAYRGNLVGAAATGAEVRQHLFDPIPSRGAKLGDTDTGTWATKINPVQREAVRIRIGGRPEMNGATQAWQVG